jgi:hypothetical protein
MPRRHERADENLLMYSNKRNYPNQPSTVNPKTFKQSAINADTTHKPITNLTTSAPSTGLTKHTRTGRTVSARKHKPTTPTTTKPPNKRCPEYAATEHPATSIPPEQRLHTELPSNDNPTPATNRFSTNSITSIPTTFQLNINGLGAKSQKYKLTALNEMVHSNENHIPFFIITESHLKNRHYDHEIAINDYSTLRADRPTVIKGGVIIYTHKDLAVDDKDAFADQICQAAMTFNETLNLIIIAIYRPPRADDKSFQNTLTKIENFIKKHENADIQMMGDLNLPYVNWETKDINPAQLCRSEINCAQSLITFMDNHLLNQMVTENTRDDKSILDLVITNNHQAIHNIEIEKTELSDHDIVWTQLSYKNLTKLPSNHNQQTDSPLDNLNLNKADWDSIRSNLAQVDWNQTLKDKDVEEMNSLINDQLITTCSNHAPARENKTQSKPYIPRKRRSLLNIRKRLNTKINICKFAKPNDHEEKLKRLNKKKSELEIEIRDAIRLEATNKEKRAIEKIKINPRAFYTYAKQKSKTFSNIGPLLDKENKLQTDPLVMSNILQDQYQKAFSEQDSGDANQPLPDNSHVPEFNDIKITENDIIKAINEIGQFSAPGPDKIPAILIKECKNEIAPALAMLWQKSIDTGQIPADLLKQTIIPIFKKENKSLPSNYRPISLTSHFIKIFERVLREKLVFHLESYNLITEHQHGFRLYRSTLTQLLHHFDSVLEILERNENADIIYLDLAKAFDKVNHNILLQKLENMKISGKISAWIKNFLTMRTQQVVVNGYKSEPAAVQSGVPQGTVLGPALFIIYMNNITEFIKSTIIKLFADDSKLIASISNQQDRENLLEDLKALLKWTDMNSMQFNDTKFQLLQIGPHDHLKQPYSYNNINIQKSENVRDLGVHLSEDMSFKYHIADITTKAQNYASWLLRTFQTRSEEVMLLLLKTYLIPRLEYCSAVWNPTTIAEIEKLEATQRTFTSKIDNMEKLNYHERLQHLKLYSLQRRRERFIIIHTFKIYKQLAPNDLKLQFNEHPRLGLQCKRLPLKSRVTRIKNLRFNFFSHLAPRLFNIMPKQIKTVKSVLSFKKQLDKFLKHIPDTPPTPGYKRANSNSLTEWGSSIQEAKMKMFKAERWHLTTDRAQGLLDNTVVTHSSR